MSPADEDPRLGRALDAIAKGKQAQATFQFLEEYLLGRQRQLDRELFEASTDKWDGIVRQKLEAHRFVMNLMQLMKAGEGSARLLTPMMETVYE